MKRTLTTLLLFSFLMTTTMFGQGTSVSLREEPVRGQTNWKAFASEVVPVNGEDAEGLFSREAGQIASVLRKAGRRNPVFIDETGYNREFVLRSAAARLAADSPGEKDL